MAAFDFSVPEGSILRVEFTSEDKNELKELSRSAIRESIRATCEDIKSLEAAIQEAAPEGRATLAERWDTARQWLTAYRGEKKSPRRKLLKRAGELKERIEKARRKLDEIDEERDTAQSHSDLSILDMWEDDVLNDLERLEGKLATTAYSLRELDKASAI